MPFVVGVLAYLPSPSSNGIQIGPVHLRAYGLCIALAIFAAVWLADRRWRRRGGEPGTIAALALWAVPGGLIGARLYHIATDYELYTHHLLNVFKVWQGGLGIWGAVAGGVAGGAIYAHRHGLPAKELLDVVAPALPLAQAIGRWGNWFNQELFGRPTTLPWGLQIAPAHRPAAYAAYGTFHPTFLYESLWDLAVVGIVLLVEKRIRLRRGYLFAVYVAAYTFGRFFTEYMRIDFAHKFLGLRLNDWTSILVFAVSFALLVLRGRPPEREEGEHPTPDGEEPMVVGTGVAGGGLAAPGSHAAPGESADLAGEGAPVPDGGLPGDRPGGEQRAAT